MCDDTQSCLLSAWGASEDCQWTLSGWGWLHCEVFVFAAAGSVRRQCDMSEWCSAQLLLQSKLGADKEQCGLTGSLHNSSKALWHSHMCVTLYDTHSCTTAAVKQLSMGEGSGGRGTFTEVLARRRPPLKGNGGYAEQPWHSEPVQPLMQWQNIWVARLQIKDRSNNSSHFQLHNKTDFGLVLHDVTVWSKQLEMTFLCSVCKRRQKSSAMFGMKIKNIFINITRELRVSEEVLACLSVFLCLSVCVSLSVCLSVCVCPPLRFRLKTSSALGSSVSQCEDVTLAHSGGSLTFHVAQEFPKVFSSRPKGEIFLFPGDLNVEKSLCEHCNLMHLCV